MMRGVLTLRRFALPRRIRWSSSSTPCDKNEDAEQLERDIELLNDATNNYGFPDASTCASIPRKFRQASNSVLSILAAQENHGARKERLMREIIRIDKCSYIEAQVKLVEINKSNDSFKSLVTLPYKLGVSTGILGGLCSLPLVFYKPTAVWFNDNFVHCDPPDA